MNATALTQLLPLKPHNSMHTSGSGIMADIDRFTQYTDLATTIAVQQSPLWKHFKPVPASSKKSITYC